MGKLIKKILWESSELDWMKGPPKFRFGEISRDLRNYFSKGDKVYLTGMLYIGEGDDDKVLHLNEEPAIVKNIREDVGVLDLTLGENITSLPIWIDSMSAKASTLDLGVFKEDDDMEITVAYKNINESDDLDWIRDTPSNQKVKPWNGNIGYPDADKTSPTYGKVYLYTDDEGVTREIKVGGLQAKHRTKNYKGEWFGSDGEVSFYDASVMDSEIQSKNYNPGYPDPYEDKYRITMSRQEYNDNALKGKLILTPNSNPIIESEEDFDWASGFTWYKEVLDTMLTDCKTLRLANFNIRQNKPYMSAGGPSIMFLSRCKEWWDYFGLLPLTDSGRGPAEWFTEDNYNDGEYSVIWNPGWGRKKITPQLEDLEHDYTSAITTKWGYGIEKQLNGIGTSEAWFVVDEDNRPIYDLIPEPAKGYAKIYEEEFFGDKLNESKDELDWIKNVKAQGFEKSKSYVVDVSDLMIDTPMSVSPTSEEYTKLTRADVLDKFKKLGYNVDDISITDADYLYIEPNDEAGYWDDVVWVKQTHWLDYDMKHNTLDPTWDGKYEMIDINNLMFLLDNNMVNESKEDKKTITEAAGISFEARKWGEIIYNEIMDNPNEKKRLIIDGYDHPEAFDGFPIDYVVIDFYDRLTGYGQEHSGYDKDGNYVVLLYIQPKLVQGQGGYDLRSVLNHEMKHAWEDYNRLSKGLPSIEQTKESQDLYNRDFILMLSDQNIRGPIKEILKYYYYLSDLEKSAYLENVYDQNKVYERVLRDIAGKDFNEFKDRFDLDINWHLMNTAYDIPFLKKFKSPIDFIDYSAEELRSKALKMIKKVNKMKYIHKK